jgi:hypothetical protein
VNDAVTDPFGSTVPLSGMIGEMAADAAVARRNVTIDAPASNSKTLDLVRTRECGRRDIWPPIGAELVTQHYVETTPAH